MATWPASLPRVLLANYTEQRQSQVVRSEMDAGAPKVRRRFTAAITLIRASWVLTTAQLTVYSDFFEWDLAGGSSTFNWTHPRTGAAVTARFLEPYVMSPMGDGLYSVTAALELLP